MGRSHTGLTNRQVEIDDVDLEYNASDGRGTPPSCTLTLGCKTPVRPSLIL